MGKKSKMTPEAASRIQSAVDSGRATKSDAGFKSRAASAAARNYGKSGSKSRRKRFFKKDFLIKRSLTGPKRSSRRIKHS